MVLPVLTGVLGGTSCTHCAVRSAAAESSLREATQACADLFGDLSESAFPELSALLVLEAELKYFRGDYAACISKMQLVSVRFPPCRLSSCTTACPIVSHAVL